MSRKCWSGTSLTPITAPSGAQRIHKGFAGRVRDRIRVKSHLCNAISFIAAYVQFTAARGRKHLNNRRAAWFLWLDIAFRTCHDRRRMPCGWFRLSFESYSGSGKALDALRQSGPRLCRLRPDVAGYFDRVRIVVAAARDSSNLRPALKGE